LIGYKYINKADIWEKDIKKERPVLFPPSLTTILPTY
jgi:hypothetical protein